MQEDSWATPAGKHRRATTDVSAGCGPNVPELMPNIRTDPLPPEVSSTRARGDEPRHHSPRARSISSSSVNLSGGRASISARKTPGEPTAMCEMS